MKSEALFRQSLSAPALYSTVRECFSKVADHREKGVATYPLADVLMSRLAIFSLKFPSLLQFDEMGRHDKQLQENLRTLFHVETVPSDTRVREVLNEIDTVKLRSPFKKLFAEAQRGKDPYIKTLRIFQLPPSWNALWHLLILPVFQSTMAALFALGKILTY